MNFESWKRNPKAKNEMLFQEMKWLCFRRQQIVEGFFLFISANKLLSFFVSRMSGEESFVEKLQRQS